MKLRCKRVHDVFATPTPQKKHHWAKTRLLSYYLQVNIYQLKLVPATCLWARARTNKQ